MKVKIRPTDRLFSDYIRQRAGWRCEVCSRICKLDDQWLYKLEASHYYSRRNESVRFDPMNVHALCFTCHQRMGGHGNQEYDSWMLAKYGQQQLALLGMRKNTYKKRDDYLDKLYIQKLMGEL